MYNFRFSANWNLAISCITLIYETYSVFGWRKKVSIKEVDARLEVDKKGSF